MKMRNNVLFIGLVLIISLVVFASCKPEEDNTPSEPSVVGKWYRDNEAATEYVEFTDTGAFLCYSLGDLYCSGSYSVFGTSLNITWSDDDGNTYPVTGVFSSSSLTINWGGGSTITYHR